MGKINFNAFSSKILHFSDQIKHFFAEIFWRASQAARKLRELFPGLGLRSVLLWVKVAYAVAVRLGKLSKTARGEGGKVC